MEFPTLPLNVKRILVIESDPGICQDVVKSLEIEGYMVHAADDGGGALRYLEHLLPDLIISDINAPGSNGTPFYQELRSNTLWTAIPVIFLLDRENSSDAHRASVSGGEDVIGKPVDADSLVRIVHARLLRSAELRIALIDQAYLETIEVLANTVEGRDPYTHGHIGRVARYAQWLAEALNWPAEQIRTLAFGARLHDIGKIVIPDQILKKPGDLTAEEWELMKQHPAAGAKIVGRIEHLKQAVNYVLYHHEHWDGTGYPYGLSGRDIPFEGRLLAIADVFDALTTDRPYHPARPVKEVFTFLSLKAGQQFDPDLVTIFIQAANERLQE